MAGIDLNLLPALEVLLAERSVTAAAKRLGLSPSAMSRTLARLRAVTGDPILVQAGRGLVATPHGEALAGQVAELHRQARHLLSPPAERFDPMKLERDFTIRANEGFVALFGARLTTDIGAAAPSARLRFAPKPDKDPHALREARIDVEIGTTGSSAPEMRSQLLFRDRFVGAVRSSHPLLGRPVTPSAYAAAVHVATSRRGAWAGPVDAALGAIGLSRRVALVVPGFLEALAVASRSDLVALVPGTCLSKGMSAGLTGFDLPVTTEEIRVSMMWHPRLDADPAQRWLRASIAAACTSIAPQSVAE